MEWKENVYFKEIFFFTWIILQKITVEIQTEKRYLLRETQRDTQYFVVTVLMLLNSTRRFVTFLFVRNSTLDNWTQNVHP